MMSPSQRAAIEELICEFGNVFSTSKHDIGRTDQIHHKINTGNNAPIRLGPCRVPIHFRQEIAGLLDDMQRQDIIEPSVSPWASPIVLVRKKDGSPRFCVDYRKLIRSRTHTRCREWMTSWIRSPVHNGSPHWI